MGRKHPPWTPAHPHTVQLPQTLERLDPPIYTHTHTHTHTSFHLSSSCYLPPDESFPHPKDTSWLRESCLPMQESYREVWQSHESTNPTSTTADGRGKHYWCKMSQKVSGGPIGGVTCHRTLSPTTTSVFSSWLTPLNGFRNPQTLSYFAEQLAAPLWKHRHLKKRTFTFSQSFSQSIKVFFPLERK